MLGFSVQEGSGVFADLSCAYISEFEADFEIVNTAAYEMLQDGCVRIDLD